MPRPRVRTSSPSFGRKITTVDTPPGAGPASRRCGARDGRRSKPARAPSRGCSAAASACTICTPGGLAWSVRVTASWRGGRRRLRSRGRRARVGCPPHPAEQPAARAEHRRRVSSSASRASSTSPSRRRDCPVRSRCRSGLRMSHPRARPPPEIRTMPIARLTPHRSLRRSITSTEGSTSTRTGRKGELQAHIRERLERVRDVELAG